MATIIRIIRTLLITPIIQNIITIILIIVAVFITIIATITPFIFATIRIARLLQSNGTNYNVIYGIMNGGRKKSGK